MSQTTSSSATAFFERQASSSRILSDYLDWVQTKAAPQWLFRGQSETWPLRPSVGRIRKYGLTAEIKAFQAFKSSAISYIDRSQFDNDWEWLALAQHHGLPTRLMDWTTNALVAFYFACRNGGSEAKDGAVLALDSSDLSYAGASGTDPFSIEETVLLQPPAVARRIVAQRGQFTVHHAPDIDWVPAKLDTFPIPANMKASVQRSLYALGVDDAFLMADLDGLASTLKWRMQHQEIF